MLVTPGALLLRSYSPLHYRPYPVTRNKRLLLLSYGAKTVVLLHGATGVPHLTHDNAL
jgi:hypothetical protein